jgi:hypothetical protein
MNAQTVTNVHLNNIPQEEIAHKMNRGISTISKKIGEIRTILTTDETSTIDGLQQIVVGFSAVQKQMEEYVEENARLQKIVDEMSQLMNQ